MVWMRSPLAVFDASGAELSHDTSLSVNRGCVRAVRTSSRLRDRFRIHSTRYGKHRHHPEQVKGSAGRWAHERRRRWRPGRRQPDEHHQASAGAAATSTRPSRIRCGTSTSESMTNERPKAESRVSPTSAWTHRQASPGGAITLVLMNRTRGLAPISGSGDRLAASARCCDGALRFPARSVQRAACRCGCGDGSRRPHGQPDRLSNRTRSSWCRPECRPSFWGG